jgi:hypothetical protein
VVAIVNLHSRRGSEAVVRKLQKEFPRASVLGTRSLEEAQAHLARHPNPGLVLSGGGDGTALGLINSLEGKLPTLGVVPLGTGNAWAHATGAPMWRRAIERLARFMGRERRVPVQHFDLLSVCGTVAHFAGTGWDAEIINDFNDQKSAASFLPKSRRNGLVGYLNGTFTRTVPNSLRRDPVQVTLINTGSHALGVDERGRPYKLPGGEPGATLYQGRASVCAAGTTTHWGFGFKAFPFARLVPGRFNMRIYDGSAIAAVLKMPSLWRGAHPCPGMHTWLLDRVKAVFSRPVPFQVGGDLVGVKSEVEYALDARTIDLVDWHQF